MHLWYPAVCVDSTLPVTYIPEAVMPSVEVHKYIKTSYGQKQAVYGQQQGACTFVLLYMQTAIELFVRLQQCRPACVLVAT